jgi:hypothetical protein
VYFLKIKFPFPWIFILRHIVVKYFLEGEIIVGITERSIFGILLDSWNFLELFLEFLENLHKIPLEFLELLWNYLGLFPLVSPSNLVNFFMKRRGGVP